MIIQFINFLKDDLNLFIKNKKGIDDSLVVFANLNNIIEKGDTVNKIIISIVNIEEERLLQNPKNYVATRTEVVYKNPAVCLNVVCLFTIYSKNIDNYDGIELLENVIQYFQSKPRLDKTTVVDPENFPEMLEKITAEFVSLNYEQTNYLWGLFGGKYYPSVLYKFKALPIDNLDETAGGSPILSTEVISKHK